MHCSEVQVLLFDPPGGRPEDSGQSQAVERHLAECPECRSAAEAAGWGGQLLDAMARSIDPQQGLRPSLELEQRVRRLAHERLTRARTATEGRGVPPRAASLGGPLLKAQATTPRGTSWWHRLGARPVWAVAALAMVVLAGAVGRHVLGGQPFARLDYADGPIQISQSGSPAGSELAHGSTPLRQAARLLTDAESQAFFSIGAARVAMDRNTAVELRQRDGFRLNRGQVWLQVQRNGHGFHVETPYGVVRVTGTRFGVTVDPVLGRVLVEVTEGTVLVSGVGGSGREVSLDAGRQVTVDDAGVGQPAGRTAGAELPPWIRQLAGRREVATTLNYLPTFMGGRD